MIPLIKVLLGFVIVFSSCQWAERKVQDRKDMKYFHRRMVWLKGKPSSCEQELNVQKYRREITKVFLLGISEHCSVLLQFSEVLLGEDDSNERIISEKYSYALTKVIVTSKELKYQSTKTTTPEFKYIGWGYKIIISFDNEGVKQSFALYMKKGKSSDPFDRNEL